MFDLTENCSFNPFSNIIEILSNLMCKPPSQQSANAPTTLSSFQVDRSLKNIYRFLQRLSVGLEQIVLDQTMYDGRFLEEFNEAEFKLKAVGSCHKLSKNMNTHVGLNLSKAKHIALVGRY